MPKWLVSLIVWFSFLCSPISLLFSYNLYEKQKVFEAKQNQAIGELRTWFPDPICKCCHFNGKVKTEE